jgi:hypothetical protein
MTMFKFFTDPKFNAHITITFGKISGNQVRLRDSNLNQFGFICPKALKEQL